MKLYCAWSSFLQNWDRRIINKSYYYVSVYMCVCVLLNYFLLFQLAMLIQLKRTVFAVSTARVHANVYTHVHLSLSTDLLLNIQPHDRLAYLEYLSVSVSLCLSLSL